MVGLPSGAKTPERSVSTPSVIVLAVTPGPVLTAPDPPPPPDALLLCPLLPQPASATSSRQTRIEPPRDFVERLMRCSPWLEVLGHERGGGATPGGRFRRTRWGRRSAPPRRRRRRGTAPRRRAAARRRPVR